MVFSAALSASDHSILEAAEEGQIEIVRKLLAQERVENEELSKTLLLLIKNKCFDQSLFIQLIDLGADVNYYSNHLTSPLIAAVKSENLECIQLILFKQAIQEFNHTPHFLIEEALEAAIPRSDILDMILSTFSCYTHVEGEFEQLLARAVEQNEMAAVEKILKHTATQPTTLSSQKYARLPLFRECQDPKLVALLISKGIDVNAKDHSKETPLLQTKRPEIAELLLLAGADLNAVNERKENALIKAISQANFPMVKLLLEKGANPNQGKPRPLCVAAAKGDLEIIQLLVQHGAHIQSNDQWTPLHFAASCGHLNVIQYFVAQGVDINAKTEKGFQPLDLVLSHNGRVDIAIYLIQQGCQVGGAEGEDTPLHKACRQKELELIKLLIEKGAPLSVRNEYDETPLDLAIEKNHIEIVKCLVINGCDLNNLSKNSPPLHRIVYLDDPELFELCLSQGADIHAKDRMGRSIADHIHPNTCPGIRYRIKVSELSEEEKVQNVRDMERIFGLAKQPVTDAYCTTLFLTRYNVAFRLCRALENQVGLKEGPIFDWIEAVESYVWNLLMYMDEKGCVQALNQCISEGNQAAVHLLLKKPSNFKNKGKFNPEPLCLAATLGHLEIARQLIDQGADPSAKNSNGATALEIAHAKKDLSLISLFELIGKNRSFL